MLDTLALLARERKNVGRLAAQLEVAQTAVASGMKAKVKSK